MYVYSNCKMLFVIWNMTSFCVHICHLDGRWYLTTIIIIIIITIPHPTLPLSLHASCTRDHFNWHDSTIYGPLRAWRRYNTPTFRSVHMRVHVFNILQYLRPFNLLISSLLPLIATQIFTAFVESADFIRFSYVSEPSVLLRFRCDCFCDARNKSSRNMRCIKSGECIGPVFNWD